MNIEKEVKKEGISIIGELDKFSVESIAKFVSKKICENLPDQHLDYNTLYARIIKLPMYIASMPEGISEANYFYKNNSIYFRDGMGLSDLEKFAIHECIHHFQEIKDKNNNLKRLGLCEFFDFKVTGMALNEGAVQLITSKALHNNMDTEKYYGITFPTLSSSYYPLLCNLVYQLAYITGEQVLFDSTLHSNDNFKNKIINACGEKSYNNIIKNLDKILYTEEKIIKLTSKLQSPNCSDKKSNKISILIDKLKSNIHDTFIKTQNLIMISYFDNYYFNLYTTEDIDEFRNKLYNYKNLIGFNSGNNFYNTYYINTMSKLDLKYEEIMNNVYLINSKNNIIIKFFNKLKQLLFNPNNEYTRK